MASQRLEGPVEAVSGLNRVGVLLVAGCVLASCTTNVKVEGRVPTPLVSKIPARVGVYYPEEFESFLHEEVIEQRGTWKVDLGDQNLVFFRNLFGAMFESVREVSEPPLPVEEMEGLDGVIVPKIVKYGFLTPDISGLSFYSASIEYEILLYDNQGNQLGSWRVVGYGKSEASVFGHDEALGEATMLAIRDGGARIAIELADQPAVVRWVASHEGEEGGKEEQ